MIVPTTRPEMGRHAAEQLLFSAGVTSEVALLGRRGYYRNTMGDPATNDRGIYDDAIFLLTPAAFVSFNANCDPSRFHPGIAVLKAGVWRYRLGVHGLTRDKARQYQALVQAAPVTVRRDSDAAAEPREETGWFGINIHCGGYSSTSSLGCQTIYPGQWDSFIALVKSEMQRFDAREIAYCLTERPTLIMSPTS